MADRDAYDITTNGQPSIYSAARDDRSKARKYRLPPILYPFSFLPQLGAILTTFTSHTFREAIRGTSSHPSD